MSGMVCPQCGGLMGPVTPGKAVLCPRCMRPVEMPQGGEADDSWSDSISDWESSIADAPRQLATALGNGRLAGRPDAYRTAIFGLFGLVAFLIALIGAVLVARQLRPLVPRGHPLPTALQQAIRQLEAPESDEARAEAARKIIRMGPAAVIAALDRTTAGNGSDLSSISQPIAHVLAEVGPDAADALGQALGSPEARVRAAAANVLCEMGAQGSGARKSLVSALGDENKWVRWYAIEALGNMGADAASTVDALLPLLEQEHADALTRRRTAEALGRIGPTAKQAARALRNARDHDPEATVRTAAGVALDQLDLVENAKKAKLRTLSEVRELIETLDSGDQLAAIAAANRLGEMGSEASDAVPALALALRNEKSSVREAAAKALGSLGTQARSVRPALQAAAHERDPEVRAAARKALEQSEGQ